MIIPKGKNIANTLVIVVSMLLILSCPIKREIKQLLGIPTTTQTHSNTNTSSFCSFYIQRKNVIKKGSIEHKFKNAYYYIASYPTYFNAQLEWINSEVILQKLKTSFVPIFLFYRKLII
jgi:hypothetical protein